MNHIDFFSLKDKTEQEIEHFLNNISKSLLDQKKTKSELRSYLESEGYDLSRDQDVIKISLLAVVLGDIGTQFSPFLREENIEKIMSICEKQKINYKKILNISEVSESLIEIIGRGLENFT